MNLQTQYKTGKIKENKDKIKIERKKDRKKNNMNQHNKIKIRKINK